MRRFTWFAMLALTIGCESPTGPRRDNSPVQTDATVYTLRRYAFAWFATAIAKS